MWERVERSLPRAGSPRGLPADAGKDRHELIDDAEPDAERALRREAVLEAVAEAEEIEVSDEELLEALGPGEGKNDPEKLLERLRERPRRLLREELRLRKAAELIAEAAKPIPLEQAAAREKIWTPEKEERDRPARGQRRRGEPSPAALDARQLRLERDPAGAPQRLL